MQSERDSTRHITTTLFAEKKSSRNTVNGNESTSSKIQDTKKGTKSFAKTNEKNPVLSVVKDDTANPSNDDVDKKESDDAKENTKEQERDERYMRMAIQMAQSAYVLFCTLARVIS